MSGIVTALTALIVVGSIGYVWFRLANDASATTDGSAGSVLDSAEQVRRVDLGTNTYVAQRALETLQADGVTCRTVSLEEGAFGIGLGERWYLVYNADDEAQVLSVVDDLLDDV